MTIEERLAALEGRVEALEAAGKARADHKAASDAANPFNQPEAVRPPAIPNGIEEVPRVGDIRAEKLACARFPDGVSRWIAVNDSDKSRPMYAEVVPGDPAHCKNVPGTYAIDTNFRDLPSGVVFLRKELNEWYLEKRPAPKCRPVKGTWDLEPIEG